MTQNGYIDLQVNGYAGVDFNQDNLTPEDLHLTCRKLRKDGVAGVLVTIITDTIEAMQRRIRRVVELREQDVLATQMVLGLHIEGPFISSAQGYYGAHPRRAIRPADPELMKTLVEAGNGLVRIVTLAPEHDAGLAVTRMLSGLGVVVSAGHCDPSLAQLEAAIDAGLSMFTHVGNGCPMTMARHDNIIQRVLYFADRLWLSFIADGIHMNLHALRNYLELAGDHAIIVTDAMSAAGMPPGRYKFASWDIEVGVDLAAWTPDRAHLLGSATTMADAHQNLTSVLRLSEQRVKQLLRTSALELLGIETAVATVDAASGRQLPAVAGPHYQRADKAARSKV